MNLDIRQLNKFNNRQNIVGVIAIVLLILIFITIYVFKVDKNTAPVEVPAPVVYTDTDKAELLRKMSVMTADVPKYTDAQKAELLKKMNVRFTSASEF